MDLEVKPHLPRPRSQRQCYSLRVKLKLNEFPQNKWELNTSLRHKLIDCHTPFSKQVEDLLSTQPNELA